MQASVSVVIPVYNDPDGLRDTLESLVDQTYPRNHHEILVVDNDSTDSTRSVATEYANRFTHIEVLVEDDIQSSYAARNTGIEASNGDLLAFVDADVTVDPSWLESTVQTLDRLGARYLGVRVNLYAKHDPPTLAERYQLAKGFPVESYVKRDRFAPTCCLFVEQSVIEAVGPFDPYLVSGGDYEFGNRVADHGIRLHYTDKVEINHPARMSLTALLNKQTRVGRGKAQLRQRHPDVMSSVVHPRHFLPTWPTHFLAQLDEDVEELAKWLLIFYLLDYIFKLTRSLSMLREYFWRFSNSREGVEE